MHLVEISRSNLSNQCFVELNQRLLFAKTFYGTTKARKTTFFELQVRFSEQKSQKHIL